MHLALICTRGDHCGVGAVESLLCGLVRSHPASLSYVHFTLWRWRAFETNVTAALRAATDGKDEAGAAVAAEQLRSLSCATPDGGKGGGSLVCLANVSAVQAPGAHSGGVPWE